MRRAKMPTLSGELGVIPSNHANCVIEPSRSSDFHCLSVVLSALVDVLLAVTKSADKCGERSARAIITYGLPTTKVSPRQFAAKTALKIEIFFPIVQH